jgi:hypothetical protein
MNGTPEGFAAYRSKAYRRLNFLQQRGRGIDGTRRGREHESHRGTLSLVPGEDETVRLAIWSTWTFGKTIDF